MIWFFIFKSFYFYDWCLYRDAIVMQSKVQQKPKEHQQWIACWKLDFNKENNKLHTTFKNKLGKWKKNMYKVCWYKFMGTPITRLFFVNSFNLEVSIQSVEGRSTTSKETPCWLAQQLSVSHDTQCFLPHCMGINTPMNNTASSNRQRQ